jgi:hypothetical protein
MLIYFTRIFDWRCIVVHYEFIPEGKPVNTEMYTDILRRLREAVRRKRPEKWRTNCLLLLHDNAPAHRSVLVKDVLAKNIVTTLQHPSYSHGLAPVEFYLFSANTDGTTFL